MKSESLRELSREDLSAKVASLKEELSKINYLKRVGQVDKPHRFREIRKNIARIYTILNEMSTLKSTLKSTAKPTAKKG